MFGLVVVRRAGLRPVQWSLRLVIALYCHWYCILIIIVLMRYSGVYIIIINTPSVGRNVPNDSVR